MQDQFKTSYQFKQIRPEYDRKVVFSVFKVSGFALSFLFGFLYLELEIGANLESFLGFSIFMTVLVLEILKIQRKYGDEVEIVLEDNYLDITFTNIGGSIRVQLKPEDILNFTHYTDTNNLMRIRVIMRNPNYNIYLKETLFTNLSRYKDFTLKLCDWLVQRGVSAAEPPAGIPL